MRVLKNTLLAGALTLAVIAVPAMAQQKTGTTILGVTVLAESSLTVTDANTTLAKTDTLFGDFTGTTNLKYRIRTTASGGSGSIVAQVNEFTGNGPKVAADLSYSSTTGGLGTAVTNQAASTTGANVISFGPNARSAKAGNDAAVNWRLGDDPQFETGSYSSTVTFTVSAT
ncbi:MAG TPA: hypothetical protein VGK29_27590 [Paludibaculum sp.]|jgi:hypothetical protein